MFVSVPDVDALSSFTGTTLLFPCESIGNVGQLAADLFITTLMKGNTLEKVGYLLDPAIVPTIGNDAYSLSSYNSSKQGQICTAAEVYQDKARSLSIVQLRSTILKNKRKEFAKRLIEWIAASQFKQVILLTSIDASQRRDDQLIGKQFRYLSSPASLNFDTQLKSLGIKPLEAPNVEYLPKSIQSRAAKRAMFYGSGIAKLVLDHAVLHDLPLLVLFQFVSEGSNDSDAFRFVSTASCLLKIKSPASIETQSLPSQDEYSSNFIDAELHQAMNEWTAPSSWSRLFGKPLQSGIF